MKISILIYIAFLSLLPSSLSSQNIKELFFDFPGEIFGRKYAQEEKQKYLNETSVGDRNEIQPIDSFYGPSTYTLAILDLAGGFLRLDALDNYVDLCYWRKSDGHKLVAICHTTSVAYMESDIEFYDYYQGEWRELPMDSIMPSPKYWDLLDKGATIRANDGAAIPLAQFSYATEILLPRKGKDITVKFELVEFADTSGNELQYRLVYPSHKKNQHPNYQLSYFWNDGIFLRE